MTPTYEAGVTSAPILVPRGRAPLGQHQESRTLAMSNTGSPRFTDFPSLCACSQSSLTNLIGSGLNLLCLQSHQNRNVVGPGQRLRFSKSAASGDENRDLTHIRRRRRGRRLVKNVFLFYFGISHLFRSIQCLSVLKLAPAEYATDTFSSK